MCLASHAQALSAHTLHMPKPVMRFAFKVPLLRYMLYTATVALLILASSHPNTAGRAQVNAVIPRKATALALANFGNTKPA